jgi:hypothetical protein
MEFAMLRKLSEPKRRKANDSYQPSFWAVEVMKLLIISDVHANWPALKAVSDAEAVMIVENTETFLSDAPINVVKSK